MPDPVTTPSEISKQNAREWVEKAPADELANWSPCGCDGCVFCTEVQRLKDERFAPKP